VISSDGSGTGQVGQNVATQLTTVTQIIKDLVGVDISELITGRVTGHAIGEGIGEHAETSAAKKRAAKAAPQVPPTTGV
jgi:flotillin